MVGVRLAVLAANGPPLLRKDAHDKVFRQVTYQESRPELPLALAGEARGRSRKNSRRPYCEEPVTRVRRRQPCRQSQIAKAGVSLPLAGGRRVRDNVVERHHRPGDQVPVFGKANWKDRLEIPVVIPVSVIQLEVVELI